MSTADQLRVLVIHTGGTFGMKKGGQGYTPSSGDLEDFLKRSAIFGTWRNATKSFVINNKDGDPPVTVSYKLYALPKLLDSSNMNPSGWTEIAETIQDNYGEYDGFVVIHGTDTMVYTASALSFMCENLKKTVVVTGAQIPIYEARSDARDNLINSVIVAAASNIKEVLLCFGSEVFRGNRCVKNDNANFAAFISPNHPAVMKLGVRFERDVREDPPRMYPGRELAICKLPKDCKVGILYLYPGITLRTVERNIQNLKGVVLLSFGAGNAPTDKDFLDTLKDSTERGTLIINVTQCPKGAVNAAYETGQMLKGSGVVSGEDITTEAAYCKLCYLLGREDLTYEQRKRELGKPLRQEMKQGEVEVPEPMREISRAGPQIIRTTDVIQQLLAESSLEVNSADLTSST